MWVLGLCRAYVIVWAAVDVGKVSIARLKRHRYIVTVLNSTNATHVSNMFRNWDVIRRRRGCRWHQPISLHNFFQRPLGWVRRHEHLERKENVHSNANGFVSHNGRENVHFLENDLENVHSNANGSVSHNDFVYFAKYQQLPP